MPHAELKYSSDLTIDVAAMLGTIEQIIQNHDSGAGDCKGRAYPAKVFHHSHLICDISLLNKPHRDAAFMQALLDALTAALKPQLPEGTKFSIGLSFSTPYYVTGSVG